MNISEIFDTYTVGSPGFVGAVQTHCGFEASDSEIKRIASASSGPLTFQGIWENESWWDDEESAARSFSDGAYDAIHALAEFIDNLQYQASETLPLAQWRDLKDYADGAYSDTLYVANRTLERLGGGE